MSFSDIVKIFSEVFKSSSQTRLSPEEIKSIVAEVEVRTQEFVREHPSPKLSEARLEQGARLMLDHK